MSKPDPLIFTPFYPVNTIDTTEKLQIEMKVLLNKSLTRYKRDYGSIYMFRLPGPENKNRIKIGYNNHRDQAVRLEQHRKCYPDLVQYEELAEIMRKSAMRAEVLIHRELRERRLKHECARCRSAKHGEWFDVSIEQAHHIADC